MARDRKRAKQRRARRRESAPAAAGRGLGQPAREREGLSQPVREDLPGALDHASGEVDEFDAALVRGADGLPADAKVPDVEERVSEADGADTDEVDADGLADAGDLLEEPEEASGGDVALTGANGAGAARVPGAPLPSGTRYRALAFLRASWAELQRVQWPDRRQVTQATAVVLGFVAVAGVYLGVADYVAKEIVEFVVG
jgi:preprotein translocase SecE subunit